MCIKAIDAYILTLKFVPDWFVTPKMPKNLDYVLFFNHLNTEYDYDDSDGDSDYNKSFKLISWFNKNN